MQLSSLQYLSVSEYDCTYLHHVHVKYERTAGPTAQLECTEYWSREMKEQPSKVFRYLVSTSGIFYKKKSEVSSGILKLPLGVCFCCQVHNTLSRRLPTLLTFAIKHRTQAWMAHTWGHGSHTEGHMDLSARQGESLSHTYKLGGKLTKD